VAEARPAAGDPTAEPGDVPAGLSRGEDGRLRCAWQGGRPDYQAYHDREWGRPQADEFRLFEKLCLEGFQSGLSWLTILRKREHFRRAFAGFDYRVVAGYGPAEVERLLADPGIVRHRGKIEAALANARAAVELARNEGSLASFLWRFAPPPGSRPGPFDHAGLRAVTRSEASVALSKALQQRGFRFVGPTTAYAFMQATGMVNDHLEGCWCCAEVEAAQRSFVRP
jgi:DNA-3-methyladenine glycosylase I